MPPQLDTFIDEMQADGTLRVNAFEFWHARGPSGLVWLAEEAVRLHRRTVWNASFSHCGLLYSD